MELQETEPLLTAPHETESETLLAMGIIDRPAHASTSTTA